MQGRMRAEGEGRRERECKKEGGREQEGREGGVNGGYLAQMG